MGKFLSLSRSIKYILYLSPTPSSPTSQLVIPLTTQDDLDKAVELLDRSVHMKSLRILLVLQSLSQVGPVRPAGGKSNTANNKHSEKLLFSPDFFFFLQHGPAAITRQLG